MAEKEIDSTTGVETTGHEWDGIRELNYPLPRWWLWTFYATIIFSVGYMVWYPAIPLIEGATAGLSGVTNRSLLKDELATIENGRSLLINSINEQSLEAIRNDTELVRFAIAGGESLYKVYCSQCHGSGAQGGPGYPNLNDDDWLWGGDVEAIFYSIRHGIRHQEDDDTRDSIMPAFGVDGILDRAQIAAVSQYVLKISAQQHDAALAVQGAGIFIDQCASCHGENGKGDRELGAPNLADAISLYGNSGELIRAQIHNPKHGVMPAWVGRLSDAELKQLAIFVHARGGGEVTPIE